MEPIKLQHRPQEDLPADCFSPEVTADDEAAYRAIVSIELTDEQRARITAPTATYPRQEAVLGIHWHPEFIPLDLISQRVATMFPNRTHELIIPTQHNELVVYGDYAGVEIDCYSEEFSRKVQLLVHFAAHRVAGADVLKAMLAHTFRYRSSQLYEFIDSILEPTFDERARRAARKTGASEDLVRFVRAHVRRLQTMIDRFESTTPPETLKNKIVRNYFNSLRDRYDDDLISHAQVFLTAVKRIVKEDFRLDYFYRTEEIIEEVRANGGGIVIPHPEQFWPILLADYDVDGIEVWNPQSREYTEFLINTVHRRNRTRAGSERPVLITMGDDTHFGEKVIHPEHQDPAKAHRELGVQPAWDDLSIRKSLIVANFRRAAVIEEYKRRLT